MQPVNIGIIGLGNVGSGTLDILADNGDRIAEKLGFPLRVAALCSRGIAAKKLPTGFETAIRTADWREVVGNPEIQIVVELVGGTGTAREIIEAAIDRGQSIVTANKELMALHGPALWDRAIAAHINLAMEASVAGGIPIHAVLREGISGDRITALYGILNGTCNYILSRIETARIPFSEALEEAQARGYAEADASEDLDGGDARAKLAILTLAGLQTRVAPEAMRARSIRGVDALDFDYAAELDCTIRQISRADLKGETLFAEVGPSLVPASSPFGRVQRNLNLVVTSGHYGGDMAFLGAGAGGDPTAVAVVSDLMFVAESLSAGVRSHWPQQFLAPKVSCDFETPWYLRFLVRDRPGIIARLAEILSAHELNIDAVLQKPGFDKAALPFVITLEPCRDSQLHPALEKMAALDFAIKPCLCLPILR